MFSGSKLSICAISKMRKEAVTRQKEAGRMGWFRAFVCFMVISSWSWVSWWWKEAPAGLGGARERASAPRPEPAPERSIVQYHNCRFRRAESSRRGEKAKKKKVEGLGWWSVQVSETCLYFDDLLGSETTHWRSDDPCIGAWFPLRR